MKELVKIHNHVTFPLKSFNEEDCIEAAEQYAVAAQLYFAGKMSESHFAAYATKYIVAQNRYTLLKLQRN